MLERDDDEAVRIGSIIKGVAKPRQREAPVLSAVHRGGAWEGLEQAQRAIDLVLEGLDGAWTCLDMQISNGSRNICDCTGRENHAAGHHDG